MPTEDHVLVQDMPDEPLTLTLSPCTGRGNMRHSTAVEAKGLRHIPFSPRAGRRCRQADEGILSL
ncbi:hypothetical protein ELH84_19795 [Rhizobium ruizarguesonis]|nr:hypothetical protein ELH84_19795 [Rhizobium ruizarguesonis]